MVVADLGSRGPWCGLEEFQLDFETMATILHTQHFTINAFTTRLNRICPRYFSKAAEVEALGTNFFAQEWGQEEHLWVNPPLHLFAYIVRKLVEQEAHVAWVFHLHPAFPFYSIFAAGGHLPNMVTWFRVVRPNFVGESRTFAGKEGFDSVVFGFDCRVVRPMSTNP